MRIAFAATVLIGIAIIFFSVVPKRVGIFGEEIDGALLHPVAYTILSLSVLIWWFASSRDLVGSVLAAIFVGGLSGVLLEIAQIPIPVRNASLVDMGMDFLGIAAGVTIGTIAILIYRKFRWGVVYFQ